MGCGSSTELVQALEPQARENTKNPESELSGKLNDNYPPQHQDKSRVRIHYGYRTVKFNEVLNMKKSQANKNKLRFLSYPPQFKTLKFEKSTALSTGYQFVSAEGSKAVVLKLF